MTGWMILLIVVLILILLLSMSIVIGAEKKSGELSVWLGYGPLRIRLLPSAPKEEPAPGEETKKAKSAKKPAKKASRKTADQKKSDSAEEKSEEPKKRKPGDIFGVVQLVLEAAKGIFPPVGRILTGFRLTDLKLYIRVGGADAAKAAIQYGQINAIVYGSLCTLKNFMRIGVTDIGIGYDFLNTGITEEFSFKLKLRLGRLLGQLFRMIARVIVRIVRVMFKNIKSQHGHQPKAAPKKQEVQ